MAYLSLNFVVPDGIDSPDSIDVVSVEENRFFLRFNYGEKRFKYFFPPRMHIFYDEDILSFNVQFDTLTSSLISDNERLKNEKKKTRLQSEQKEFPRRRRNKKA